MAANIASATGDNYCPLHSKSLSSIPNRKIAEYYWNQPEPASDEIDAILDDPVFRPFSVTGPAWVLPRLAAASFARRIHPGCQYQASRAPNNLL
jgi:hypothetical protein